jgi:glycosyltransferase involved in cell wall biosynthesis
VSRILGLCSGDPTSRLSFSGSARQLFISLDGLGVLSEAVDVDLTRPMRLATRALELARSRRAPAHRLRARWSARAVELRSRRAIRSLARSEADAVLMYGTDYFPAEQGVRPARPVGAALDATFAQIARAGEHDFGQLTPLEVEACVARQRDILERCAVLFPRTEWCAASLEEDYGVAHDRLVVTGAGVNFDREVPERERYDGRTLLFVGRDWQRKNGPLVLDAFRLARRARPDLRLEVVGPSGLAVQEPGVEWVGALDGERRDELQARYLNASLFLCPSRFEPFGVAILEAMSAGCPAVALDRGAAREIIEDGVTGSLLRDDEPSALAKVILGWTSDLERLSAAGARAKATVQERWGWDRAARRVEQGLLSGGIGPLLKPQGTRVRRQPVPGERPARAARMR